MKLLRSAAVLGLLVVAAAGAAQAQAEASAEPVLRGEPIGTAPVVALGQVIANPQAYTSSPVLVEGLVLRNCENTGCWLQLAPTTDGAGIRVVTNHAFFIPMNSAGMKARAEGVVEIAKLSKEDADKREEQGSRVERHADGTATEVRFVATGVELRQ
jgi:hypothetical protein